MLAGQGNVNPSHKERMTQSLFVTQLVSELRSQNDCGWLEICCALCGSAVSVSACTKELSALARGTEMR